MSEKLTIEEVKKDILSLGTLLNEVIAVGIFGSLARGEDFNKRSDIDILIVVEDEMYKNGPPRQFEFEWYRRLSQLFYDKYRRDVTVLLYPIGAIKNVVSWKTLGLAAEAILVYDKEGKVERLFKRICQKAVEIGLERVKMVNQYVWCIKPEFVEKGRIIELTLADEDI